MIQAPKPAFRRETLRDALPATLDLLHRRRARDIAPGYIDDYVALRWLEWHAGGLRVTPVGEHLCQQVAMREVPEGALP